MAKLKKRTLSMLMAMILVLGLLPISVMADELNQNEDVAAMSGQQSDEPALYGRGDHDDDEGDKDNNGRWHKVEIQVTCADCDKSLTGATVTVTGDGRTQTEVTNKEGIATFTLGKFETYLATATMDNHTAHMDNNGVDQSRKTFEVPQSDNRNKLNLVLEHEPVVGPPPIVDAEYDESESNGPNAYFYILKPSYGTELGDPDAEDYKERWEYAGPGAVNNYPSSAGGIGNPDSAINADIDYDAAKVTSFPAESGYPTLIFDGKQYTYGQGEGHYSVTWVRFVSKWGYNIGTAEYDKKKATWHVDGYATPNVAEKATVEYFVMDGTTASATPKKTDTIKLGETATDYTADQLNYKVEEHHTFTGWYTDPECTKSYDFDQAVNVKNLKLYAKVEKDAPSLRLTKTVTGLKDTDNAMRTFAFTLTAATVGENATAQISIQGNGSKTIDLYLPADHYIVEETNVGKDVKVTYSTTDNLPTSDPNVVYVSEGETAEMTVTNSYAQERYDAAFFLRADRTIQVENGNSHYSSSEYYPETQTWTGEDGKHHSQHSDKITGVISSTMFENEDAGQIMKDLTTQKLEQVLAKYQAVENVIVEGPVLGGSDEQSRKLTAIVREKYNVTESNGVFYMGEDPVGVLWYVAKSMTSGDLINDGCDYHVDGVVYNTITGQPVPLKYQLTVNHEYTTYWQDAQGNKHQVGETGRTSTAYQSNSAASVQVDGLKAPEYQETAYTYTGAVKDGQAYTQDSVAYGLLPNGTSITLQYERILYPAQLTIIKSFQDNFPANVEADFALYAGESAAGTPVKTFKLSDMDVNAADGTRSYTIEGLAPGKYFLVESNITGPEGYTFGVVYGERTLMTLSESSEVEGLVVDVTAGVSGAEIIANVRNTFTDQRKADVDVTKDGPAKASVGQEITYTITAENVGQLTAENVRVEDVLPTGLTYQSSNTATGTYDATTGVWTIGQLAAKATATLTIKAIVNDAAIPAEETTGEIVNVAVVKYDGQPWDEETDLPEDPNDVDDAKTEIITGTVTVDKTVESVNGGTPQPSGKNARVHVGDTIVYLLKVSNNGPASITVDVTDTLPVKGLNVTKTSPTATPGNGTLTWRGVTVPANGSTELRVTATVLESALDNLTSGTLTNAVVVDVPGTDKDPDDKITTVVEDSGLVLRKTFASGSALTANDFNDGDITFTVENKSKNYSETITLSQATAAEGVALKLEPGVYTVTEAQPNLPAGYAHKTTVTYRSSYGSQTQKDDTLSVEVEVRDGATATVTFNNSYTPKIYRVVFDINSSDYPEIDNTLTLEHNRSFDLNANRSFTWGGLVDAPTWRNGNRNSDGGKLELIFTMDKKDEVKNSGTKVSAEPAPGYVWDGQYVLTNGAAAGQVSFDSLAAAVETIDNYAEEQEDRIYLKPDGYNSDPVSIWTIYLKASCTRQVNYTFNDFGSEHVEMAYWTENSATALTEVPAFGKAASPVQVTAQGPNTSSDQYNKVIFFVKAEDGYQINPQVNCLNLIEKPANGSVEGMTATGGQIFGIDTVSTVAEGWAEDAIAAAKAAGYTHYFAYTDNAFNNHEELTKPYCLNRYFMVKATLTPTLTIYGNKSVIQGGNMAPTGVTTFTFELRDSESNLVDTAEVRTTGLVSNVPFAFDELQFTKAGTYTYTVTEVNNNTSVNWRYDNAVYTVTVTVTEQADGSLTSDFTMEGVRNNTAIPGVTAAAFTNVYTRSGGGTIDRPDRDPGPTREETEIPDGPTPTTELPDEDVPTTDIPEEDVPMSEEPFEEIPEEDVPLAEAPKTGDNALLWVLAAAASGIGLVWLSLSGKKRRDDAR